MYRRRAAGSGGRTARKKRPEKISALERRRLLQLGASVALFLLVFLGRGVFPQQMQTWKSILSADTDFRGAVTAFGQNVSEGTAVLDALETFWLELTGNTPPSAEEETGTISVEPLNYRAQIHQWQFEGAPAFPVETETAGSLGSEPAPSEEEAVVTAVAQAYTEDGQELPERVSLQYYALGLEETTAPVIGSVTSSFGYRDHPVSGEYTFHTAVDLGVSTGTDVLAFADGTVEYIGENSIYGLYVKVDHDNGVATFYAHCSKLLVSKGDTVSCGQVIAKSGQTGNATGPHLHFSIEKDSVRLDPTYYLDLS
jgi:murein DD-endopeptidase MepM/ murein hydrolase activator NlpD